MTEKIIEGTGAKTGVLHSLGSDLDQGPEAYFILLNNLVTGLK